jgi:hypothetical protein
VVEADSVIWIAKRRTDHAAIFPTSAPKIFNAAGLIGLVAAVDLADLVAAALAATASAGVDSVVVDALAVSAAAAASGADDEN